MKKKLLCSLILVLSLTSNVYSKENHNTIRTYTQIDQFESSFNSNDMTTFLSIEPHEKTTASNFFSGVRKSYFPSDKEKKIKKLEEKLIAILSKGPSFFDIDEFDDIEDELLILRGKPIKKRTQLEIAMKHKRKGELIKAIELFNTLKKQGSSISKIQLAMIYYDEKNKALYDPKESIKLLKDVVHKYPNYIDAMVKIARLNIQIRNFKQTFKWAFKANRIETEEESKSSKGGTQYILGMLYLDGYGTKKNILKGKEYIKKAFLFGNLEAKALWENRQLWKY